MVKNLYNSSDFFDFLADDQDALLNGQLASALGGLDPELQTIVKRVYGISRPTPQSYQEIADDVGATPDAIEKLHKTALRVLFKLHDTN